MKDTLPFLALLPPVCQRLMRFSCGSAGHAACAGDLAPADSLFEAFHDSIRSGHTAVCPPAHVMPLFLEHVRHLGRAVRVRAVGGSGFNLCVF